MQVILNKGAVLRESQPKINPLHLSKQQAVAEPGRISAEPVQEVEQSLNKRVSKTSPVGFNQNMCWMKRRSVITILHSHAPRLLLELLLTVGTGANLLFQEQFPLFLDGFDGECPEAPAHSDDWTPAWRHQNRTSLACIWAHTVHCHTSLQLRANQVTDTRTRANHAAHRPC